MKLPNKKVPDFRLSADSDLTFLLPRHLMHEFDYARTLAWIDVAMWKDCALAFIRRKFNANKTA